MCVYACVCMYACMYVCMVYNWFYFSPLHLYSWKSTVILYFYHSRRGTAEWTLIGNGDPWTAPRMPVMVQLNT